jgi:hypothetical protein
MAQKKSTGARRKTVKPTPTPAPVADFKAEAGQVAEQIKNVSKFIYIYGKIVNGLEVAEEQERQGKVSPTAATKNRESRDAIVTSIRNLKAGLANLGRNFQGNPRLQVQYLKLNNAVDAVNDAERLASAGKYDDAGKSLVTAVDRLTDTVIALR